MDCLAVRDRLAGYVAGRLAIDERGEVAGHLQACSACRQAREVESQLTAALDRLPRHTAPQPLRHKVEGLVGASPVGARAATPGPAAARPRRSVVRSVWMASAASACVTAALVLAVVGGSGGRRRDDGAVALVTEAVNDHLRVISSSHPVEIESGGIHQVKPWFTGRLDFAPRLSFSGDDEFPLVGGSVGYLRDRKAAVLVFKRRLHTITLLVFPPEGLDWPPPGPGRLGRLSISEEVSRGFSVLLWRDGGLGYALISDVNPADLRALAVRLNAAGTD